MNLKLDNVKHLPPVHTGPSANLCHTLRRKATWKGYCILPPEAYLTPPEKRARIERENRKQRKAEKNRMRRETYHANVDASREKANRRTRAYRKKPVSHMRMKTYMHGCRKRIYTRDHRMVNQEFENQRRRERYATDTDFREQQKARSRKNAQARRIANQETTT